MKTFNKVYNVLASKYIRKGLNLGDELYYEDCQQVESEKALKEFNDMKVYSIDINTEYYEIDENNYKTLITFNLMNQEQAKHYENK